LINATFNTDTATGGAGGGNGATGGQGKGGAIFVMSGATAISLNTAPTFSANSAANAGMISANPQDNVNVFGTLTVAAPTLTSTAGTPQSALLNQPFATALQATLKDGSGNPIPGVVLTFSAPTSGASATLSVQSGVTDANGQVSVAATANGISGSYTVTVSGDSLQASFSLQNVSPPPTPPTPPSPPPPPPPPPAMAYYAVGAGLGSSLVTVFNAATGTPVTSFFAFDGYNGGVTVVTARGRGGAPQVVVGTAVGSSAVKVFDARTGALLQSFFAFDGFAGGVSVGAGDVNGDGIADLVVGTATAFSQVKVFDGATGALLQSFFALPGFTGGVSVGAGDLFHTGVADIIVGTATGGSVVGVFDGRTGSELALFVAFAGDNSGVSVSAGDLYGTGFSDILVGANANGNVKAFDGAANLLQSFFAYPGFSGAVRVGSVVNVATGRTELLTGAGPGADPHVEQFDGPSQILLASFDAFDPSFLGGVFIG
jgi:hypothetical protein